MAATVLIALVAALHAWFLVLEMFLWERPFGRKTFGMSAEQAATTATLAKNQGIYNGFLAAGLIWSLLAPGLRVPLATFFLTCVVIAGVYGGFTVSKRIMVIQALPAALGLVALYA